MTSKIQKHVNPSAVVCRRRRIIFSLYMLRGRGEEGCSEQQGVKTKGGVWKMAWIIDSRRMFEKIN